VWQIVSPPFSLHVSGGTERKKNRKGEKREEKKKNDQKPLDWDPDLVLIPQCQRGVEKERKEKGAHTNLKAGLSASITNRIKKYLEERKKERR